jgi:fumarate reductase subunit C
MKSDLELLLITTKEIEIHSGMEVNELFIGSIWGGIYRIYNLRKPKYFLLFLILQIIILAIVFVFSLPLGFAATRGAIDFGQKPVIYQFLAVTLGSTLLVFIGWHLYKIFVAKSLKMLDRLVDEIDRYNTTINAVDLLDRLSDASNSRISMGVSRGEVLEALQLTRENLISSLITERILRKSKGIIDRRVDLLADIERNLFFLKELEIEDRASEYGEILNEALQIGISVRKEMQKFTARSR